MLTVKKCKYGRGVFATKDIRAGKVIIVNHLLLLTEVEREQSLLLRRYDFSFKSDSGIALGIASLMNHSTRPNADFDTDYDDAGLPIVWVTTTKPIKKGSQILVDYGYDPREVK